MASQKDIQDLIRLLTAGRNKLPMMSALGRVKALQGVGIRTIEEVASAEAAVVKAAIGDEKAAKQLQTAAKNSLKEPSKKRGATAAADDNSLTSASPKRKRSAYELDAAAPQTPRQIEASLALPAPSADEEEMARTTLYTNRAPLVLAFAVSLLKFTMPEQPLSSQLSLAQALVSAGAQSKAANLGIAAGLTAEREGWGQGQPTVRIMTRDIHVLKRGDYDWRSPEEEEDAKEEGKKETREGEGEGEGEEVKEKASDTKAENELPEDTAAAAATPPPPPSEPEETATAQTNATPLPNTSTQWNVSQPLTLNASTFLAHATSTISPSAAHFQIHALLTSKPTLQTASHNMFAFRTQTPGSSAIYEESSSDGETGAGPHLLALLQSLQLVNTLIVVSRWYGGRMLGPDRWRCITRVCHDALAQRLRIPGVLGAEPLWGLDLEAMRAAEAPATGGGGSSGGSSVGMPIYRPEAARAYIMKAFATAAPPPLLDKSSDVVVAKKKTGVALEREKEHNLALLLGALDLLFASWVDHISREELNRRAWSWYIQVRPDVESGPAGWGGKGDVRLADILHLRRKG